MQLKLFVFQVAFGLSCVAWACLVSTMPSFRSISLNPFERFVVVVLAILFFFLNAAMLAQYGANPDQAHDCNAETGEVDKPKPQQIPVQFHCDGDLHELHAEDSAPRQDERVLCEFSESARLKPASEYARGQKQSGAFEYQNEPFRHYVLPELTTAKSSAGGVL